MNDLVIIGAGPAGLAAALYAMKKRLKYVVLSETLGGKANYSVNLPDTEDYHTITAKQLVAVYRNRLEYLRHSYRLERAERVDTTADGFAVTTSGGAVEEARSVIVATGTSTPHLNVPGERELLGKALGTSSISYSHLLHGRTVFITGNSDRVLKAAVELSIQAEQVGVALLTDGTYTHGLVDSLDARDNVEIIHDATIERFSGSSRTESVTLTTGGHEQEITADAFFVEPEPAPNNQPVHELLSGAGTQEHPALSAEGFIVVDCRSMTRVPGLFAAGDVTDGGYEQALVALGEGTTAALAAYESLLST